MDIANVILAIAGVGSAAGAIYSARVAIASRRAAESALALQQEQWDAQRSALICFRDSNVHVPNHNVSNPATHIGVTLHNRGPASATDITAQFRIKTSATSSLQTQVQIKSELQTGETFTARLTLDSGTFPELSDARLALLESATLVVAYQDFRTHKLEFHLNKHNNGISAFSLGSATMDGEPHPGHLFQHEFNELMNLD